MGTKTEEDVKDRVAAGIVWILEDGPRFGFSLSSLNPTFLDIGDPENCALAHLGRDLNRMVEDLWDERTLRRIHELDPSGDYSLEWQVEHGFRKSFDGLSQEYGQLTDAWIEALEALEVATA